MPRKDMKSHTMFTILIFLTSATTILAADIQIGSTISASDPKSLWPSPTTAFTFTFIPDPTGATSAQFAAIIFGNFPNIPIWIAGSTTALNGGAADSTATISLVSTGNLELRNGTSKSLIWQSSTAGLGVSSAALDDSGNFVLRNGSGSKIWSSFDNPTDTIVPNQNFTTDQNLTNGIYSFSLKGNGNLTLLWNNTILYYNSGLNSSSSLNVTSPSLTLLPIGILALQLPLISIPQNLAYSNDFAQEGNNTFRFVKLDNDGNLRIYSSTIGSGTTSIGWSALQDQCLVYGYCGNFGICSSSKTGSVCGCPSLNFDPVDPSDSRKGCRRKIDLQSCQGNQSTLVLDHTVLLTYPPESSSGAQVFFAGYQPCRTNCLLTPGCVGSTSLADGTGDCYQKISTFISGYQSPAVPSTSFFKICGTPMPNPIPGSVDPGKRHRKLRVWIAVVVVLITLVIVFIVVGSLWFWCLRATKGFKEKLGAGGFGAVYKGVLANKVVAARFRRTISHWEKGELLGRGSFGSVYEGIADGGFFFAVKEVSLLDQGETAKQSIYQLEQEIALLSQFEHDNIVQYYGTDKDESKLYIFLELAKGSLLSLYQKYHLQDPQVSAYTRQILHGLKYLHDQNVVHRDIKCANILVDARGSVKLADFGLAKATKLNDVKSFKGTVLWTAPEVVNTRNQGYGLAADIWSLGCTVLEMLTGQFPYTHLEPMAALFRIGKGELPRVPESLTRNARDFILQCLQVNPNSRPTASQLLDHPFVQRSLPSSGSTSPCCAETPETKSKAQRNVGVYTDTDNPKTEPNRSNSVRFG